MLTRWLEKSQNAVQIPKGNGRREVIYGLSTKSLPNQSPADFGQSSLVVCQLVSNASMIKKEVDYFVNAQQEKVIAEQGFISELQSERGRIDALLDKLILNTISSRSALQKWNTTREKSLRPSTI